MSKEEIEDQVQPWEYGYWFFSLEGSSRKSQFVIKATDAQAAFREAQATGKKVIGTEFSIIEMRKV